MSDYTNNAPHELGWDDEIVNDSGSYLLLEEGDYSFTVTGFERARFPGSAKIPPCNKAVLTLTVEADGGTTSVKYDLILYSTMEWKLSEFFRAIGQKKHGEPLRPRWNELVGSRGRAHFKPRAYTKKDGSEGKANDVEKFYDYDPAAMGGGWSDMGDVSTPWDTSKF
ncbi:MAG: hypothetical protein K2M42_12165 [Oscillospiraceae bacterium]|nr:hypothetical protein [Oscillospiraceae bacterium]